MMKYNDVSEAMKEIIPDYECTTGENTHIKHFKNNTDLYAFGKMDMERRIFQNIHIRNKIIIPEGIIWRRIAKYLGNKFNVEMGTSQFNYTDYYGRKCESIKEFEDAKNSVVKATEALEKIIDGEVQEIINKYSKVI